MADVATTAAPSSSKGLPLWLIIVIAVAGVVLLLAIALVIRMHFVRKRREQERRLFMQKVCAHEVMKARQLHQAVEQNLLQQQAARVPPPSQPAANMAGASPQGRPPVQVLWAFQPVAGMEGGGPMLQQPQMANPASIAMQPQFQQQMLYVAPAATDMQMPCILPMSAQPTLERYGIPARTLAPQFTAPAQVLQYQSGPITPTFTRLRRARNAKELPAGPPPVAPDGFITVPMVLE